MNLTTKEKRIFLKLAEELTELAVELLQAVNKPNKNNLQQINSEISDIENWIKKLRELNQQ